MRYLAHPPSTSSGTETAGSLTSLKKARNGRPAVVAVKPIVVPFESGGEIQNVMEFAIRGDALESALENPCV